MPHAKLWADGPAALRYVLIGAASGNAPELQPYIKGLTESTADFTAVNPSKQVRPDISCTPAHIYP